MPFAQGTTAANVQTANKIQSQRNTRTPKPASEGRETPAEDLERKRDKSCSSGSGKLKAPRHGAVSGASCRLRTGSAWAPKRQEAVPMPRAWNVRDSPGAGSWQFIALSLKLNRSGRARRPGRWGACRSPSKSSKTNGAEDGWGRNALPQRPANPRAAGTTASPRNPLCSGQSQPGRPNGT